MPHNVTSDMTKKLLTASLKKFMTVKPLSKISIREIVEDCGLNRQTFYYHFEDIYDLVKWMYNQEAIALLDQHEGVLSWQDGLLQFINYLQENRKICLCALNSMGREHMKRFFYLDIHRIIEYSVSSFGKKMNVSPEYEQFLTHCLTISLAALAESWLIGEIKLKPEELIHFIDITIQDQMIGALSRSTNN